MSELLTEKNCGCDFVTNELLVKVVIIKAINFLDYTLKVRKWLRYLFPLIYSLSLK